MELIRIDDLSYSYESGPALRAGRYALRGVDLSIRKGQYIAVIGANGSGKSTLLKHLNGLLVPTEGEVRVSGMSTKDKTLLKEIRRTVGMVFQNPETQLVTTLVEDEVAFGPENLGLEPEEITERVEWAMAVTGLRALQGRPPHLLSTGQKQLLTVASVLAMRPDCLVLDEATSMLDPASRKRVDDTVRRLHNDGMTVIASTHSMDEAAEAGRVIVLAGGEVAADGEPREIFSRRRILRELRLELPTTVRIADLVKNRLFVETERLFNPRLLASAVSDAYRKGGTLR
ncbi:MAG: energy-coupling factor transporter ATPase [Spirochaetes bacterium]|nr:energy-coupling factor transporter ATPase [Spirochaetota bacterium]